MHCVFFLSCLLLAFDISNAQQAACSSYVGQINSLEQPAAASTAFSSFLMYGRTKTVTTTVTKRRISTVATVTSFVMKTVR
jgi:hypothetical protein